MLEWTLGLLPVLPEVIDLFCRLPVQLPEHSTFLYGLQENAVLREHSALMARLLNHLLRSSNSLRYECGFASEITRKLHAAGADSAVLRTIVESLARLGCGEAVHLRTDLGL
jgi:hypothetical protein